MDQPHQLTHLTLSSIATQSVSTIVRHAPDLRHVRKGMSVLGKMTVPREKIVQEERSDLNEKLDRKGTSDLNEKLARKGTSVLRVKLVRINLKEARERARHAKRRLLKIWQKSEDCSASSSNMKVSRNSSADRLNKVDREVQ